MRKNIKSKGNDLCGKKNKVVPLRRHVKHTSKGKGEGDEYETRMN
jgi:hypothetical protein